MYFFVLVTFDFTAAHPKEYAPFEKLLASIYLTRRIGDGPTAMTLSDNTFAGELHGNSVGEIVERVKAQFNHAASFDWVKGHYSIIVAPKESITTAIGTFGLVNS